MNDKRCKVCGCLIPDDEILCCHCGDYDDMQTFRKKTTTNGDHIRSMTDRELAQYIETIERRALFTDGVTPASTWLRWLQKERDG